MPDNPNTTNTPEVPGAPASPVHKPAQSQQQKQKQKQKQLEDTTPGAAPATQEEPDPMMEPAIPSDGKDEVGERMMEDLGRERRAKKESQ